MAHSKSARKRIRQNLARRLLNHSQKSALRTLIKKFDAAATSGNAESAATLILAVQRKIDKAASKNILHRGTADRIKSRLAARLKALKAEKK